VIHSGAIRVAAVEVSHWHSLWDAAYLKMLATMRDVQIVGVHDPSAGVAETRAVMLGNPPVFTDHATMLAETRPDFVVALGQHRRMAETAHDLLDHGYPFMMEKPMGVSAAEVQSIADKAADRKAFVAVPLPQRYSPFVTRARQMLAEGRFGRLSHLYLRLNRPTSARYPAWGSAWMLDPDLAGGGCLRNLGNHCFDLFLHLTGEEARVTGCQVSRRAHDQRVEDYASVQLRSAGGVLGTIEVGNTVPHDGSDTEFKIAGRDAILVLYHDHTMRLITSAGEETMAAPPAQPLYFTCVREILDRWRRGEVPRVSAGDLVPVAALIDEAYALARD
jgi:predicted dehydrogenase